MNTITTTPHPQDAFIELARERLAADPRLLAAWLEGSYAEDTADAASDVDLHVAVPDDAWDEVVAGAEALLGGLAPIIGRTTLRFASTHLLAAAVATAGGPVRADLFIERRSNVGSAPRPHPPVVLFDHDGVAAELRVDLGLNEGRVATRVAGLLDDFFFGFTFPARLSVRGEHGSLLLNLVIVIYQFIVPAMLAQDRPAEAHRPVLHNERKLSPARRQQVDALLAAVHRGFAGIGEGGPEPAAVAEAHRLVVGTLLAELHAACQATGVEWPEDSEREVRAFFLEELGITL